MKIYVHLFFLCWKLFGGVESNWVNVSKSCKENTWSNYNTIFRTTVQRITVLETYDDFLQDFKLLYERSLWSLSKTNRCFLVESFVLTFQIIAEMRVVVFWNLIWLHFLWDTYTLDHYCQLKSQFFFFQGVFKECCGSGILLSCQNLHCWRNSLLARIFFHFLVLVPQLWSLRILPVLQEFYCPAREMTLLVCLQWIIVPVSPYSTVCLNSLSSVNKHGWIIMLV